MNRFIRYSFFIFTAFSLLFSVGCSDNNNEEPPPLEGLIAGEAWTFKYAKAIYNEIDQIYDTELYGTQQTNDDPCQIVFSGEAFLSFQLPNATGNYQIPADIIVKFEQPGTSNDFYTAVSGYVDITSITSGQVVGFVQAYYDDDNSVEGTFSFLSCN
jgi:hypothetical protein